MKLSTAVRCYQAGDTREQAISRGAVPAEFDALEAKYQGASIPAHELHGFKYQAPYSCDFHTGGAAGAQLRELCKQLKEKAL